MRHICAAQLTGWVLITLMTAGLVVALWALAGEAFTSMFQDAMNKVRGAG